MLCLSGELCSSMPGVTNLRLASHMRHFEGLLWLSINVPEFSFHCFVNIFLKIIIVPFVFLMCPYVNDFIPL
jgi:hypothetical protein